MDMQGEMQFGARGYVRENEVERHGVPEIYFMSALYIPAEC